ncbi:anhydro-N-acetylmuramic acid kinase [compost metagenome]
MIIKNETSEIIGDIGFKGFNQKEQLIDIGYGIILGERRQGYAEEAAKALIRWAFEQGIVKEITAKCLTDNVSSIHLLQKLNFKEVKRDDIFLYWSLPYGD